MTSNGEFNFEILTPSGLGAKIQVEEISLPGTEGVFGVLKGHMNMVSSTKSGCVKIYKNGTVTKTFIVCDGIAHITGEDCKLLVEKATDLQDAKLSDAKESLEHVKHKISKTESEIQKSVLENEVIYWQAIIDELKS